MIRSAEDRTKGNGRISGSMPDDRAPRPKLSLKRPASSENNGRLPNAAGGRTPPKPDFAMASRTFLADMRPWFVALPPLLIWLYVAAFQLLEGTAFLPWPISGWEKFGRSAASRTGLIAAVLNSLFAGLAVYTMAHHRFAFGPDRNLWRRTGDGLEYLEARTIALRRAAFAFKVLQASALLAYLLDDSVLGIPPRQDKPSEMLFRLWIAMNLWGLASSSIALGLLEGINHGADGRTWGEGFAESAGRVVPFWFLGQAFSIARPRIVLILALFFMGFVTYGFGWLGEYESKIPGILPVLLLPLEVLSRASLEYREDFERLRVYFKPRAKKRS